MIAPLLRPLIRAKRRLLDGADARRALALAERKRVIVGASGIGAPNWIMTDAAFLDIGAARDWARLAPPASLEAILAEHVWEHLDQALAQRAATHCHRFLRPGGYLRVAVPDGLHPDPDYLNAVRPGGRGPGADDHKVLYRHDSLAALFEQSGFEVRAYEYFDEAGKFHFREWDPRDGMIWRSLRYDERNRDGKPHYTSIVLDAVKTGNDGAGGGAVR